MADDGEHRPRPRSNTNTFAGFGWRRPPPSTPTTTTLTTLSRAVSIEGLIEGLTPPAVPSLNYARSLSAMLPSASPLPSLHVFTPILGSLCAQDSPSSLQIAGFEILVALCTNTTNPSMTSSDVLACLALFRAPWSTELWEPRFRALVALSDAIPHKDTFTLECINLLKFWIKSAFDPILSPYPLPLLELAERQRSLDDYFTLLVSLFHGSDPTVNLLWVEAQEVLDFLGNMVHVAILLPEDQPLSPVYPSKPPEQSPQRVLHRRNQSSTSIPKLTSTVPIRHPADIAISGYLLYLTDQLRYLSYTHLDSILPLLFRALAFHASPLPRLSLSPLPEHHSNSEKQISSMLDSLFSGSHSTSCSIILKRHLSPCFKEDLDPLSSVQGSIGAARVLHTFMRRGLLTRLARAYIGRASSISYTPSGAPGQIDLPSDVIQLAWPKEDLTAWELFKVSRILAKSIAEWVKWRPDETMVRYVGMRDLVLMEAAGIINDVLHAFDDRVDDDDLDEEESAAVGQVLIELVSYLRIWQNPDGSPFIIPRSHPTDVNIPLLRTLSFMLSRDLTLHINSFIPTVMLSIANHLSDLDAAQAISALSIRHSFSPTSAEWLETWTSIFSNSDLLACSKPMTKRAIMEILQNVHSTVKDITAYRKPLVKLVFDYWRQKVPLDDEDGETKVVWYILGEEVVLRISESAEQPSVEDEVVESILDFLSDVCTSAVPHTEGGSITQDMPPSFIQTAPDSSSGPVSPSSLSTWMQSYEGPNRDRENAMPSVMSLLASLAAGHSSRSQSQQPKQTDDVEKVDQVPLSISVEPPFTRAVGAILSLILIFNHMVFTSHVVPKLQSLFAIRIYELLLRVLEASPCSRAKLTVLQYFMRLRADRDHRLYFASEDYDRDGLVMNLAALINRLQISQYENFSSAEEGAANVEVRRSRTRVLERNVSGASRGRGGGLRRSRSRSTRSRSGPSHSHTPVQKRVNWTSPLWRFPDVVPFITPVVGYSGEGLASYNPTSPDEVILPVSNYLSALVDILEGATDWEILSYILCYLPAQLSNKHLFCGPKCRTLTGRLLKTLCGGISKGKLAADIQYWPDALKVRDAHGLAYHSLSVLISYKHCFDGHLLHALVEVLLDGLSGQPSTVKCCLHALSLCAFELQPSMRKYLPRILEKLSQIMSNPAMAVHIIGFLTIIGSIPTLHANFTDADFKMIFGVALQYLQQHNRPDSPQTISWALSQHVRVMAYYIVYVWFLAVRLSDRPRHISFITRQLLLANEGKKKVDQPTEVCFDWLARYTYASADPRPANSFLCETVMNPRISHDPAVVEKTWIVGNSVVTIRALPRLGWLEVLSRRASGLTKFLCRAENVPMVGPGDVNPDMLSLPASLTMDRVGRQSPDKPEMMLNDSDSGSGANDEAAQPDPITGYVWSGTAPSQRRKDVVIDPSFFPLQLSAYPDLQPQSRPVLVTDTFQLKSFFRTLDRMPVIDTHKVGILYVAPGQSSEHEILRNTHGSPAYTRFLEGIGRLINLRGQMDVYAGGLDPDEDGEYAYAWWDDNSQILYHAATLMPTDVHDDFCNNKKRHIGNDFVRIIWNDAGKPYKFDTLTTQFQFVNIVIEAHSRGAISAFSDNVHENEYFKVTVQSAPDMTEFLPIGEFKLISASNLPLLIRQLSLLSDWFAFIFQTTERDTQKIEVVTNWRSRLETIQRFKARVCPPGNSPSEDEDIVGQQSSRDFSSSY